MWQHQHIEDLILSFPHIRKNKKILKEMIKIKKNIIHFSNYENQVTDMITEGSN